MKEKFSQIFPVFSALLILMKFALLLFFLQTDLPQCLIPCRLRGNWEKIPIFQCDDPLSCDPSDVILSYKLWFSIESLMFLKCQRQVLIWNFTFSDKFNTHCEMLRKISARLWPWSYSHVIMMRHGQIFMAGLPASMYFSDSLAAFITPQ